MKQWKTSFSKCGRQEWRPKVAHLMPCCFLTAGPAKLIKLSVSFANTSWQGLHFLVSEFIMTLASLNPAKVLKHRQRSCVVISMNR